MTITAAERPALIEAVYSERGHPRTSRATSSALRNRFRRRDGAVDPADLAATPEDLRALANQRAAAVRNRLETDGKVARDRLFLVEPKLNAEGIKDKGATTRVDFSLK